MQLQIILATLLASGSLAAPRPKFIHELPGEAPPGAVACTHAELKKAKCLSFERCFSFENETSCTQPFVGRRATTAPKDIKVPPGAVACDHVELNEAKCSSDERCVSFDEGNETKCVPKATDGQGTGGPRIPSPGIPETSQECNEEEAGRAKCPSNSKCLSFDDGHGTFCKPEPAEFQPMGNMGNDTTGSAV